MDGNGFLPVMCNGHLATAGQPVIPRLWRRNSKWCVQTTSLFVTADILQLVKMKKPTGTGKRPHFITKAKDIDQQINAKVATRYIDDAELDNDGHSGASDHEHSSLGLDAEGKIQTVVAHNGRSEVPEPCRTQGWQTANFVGKIAAALNPETQRAYDEECANYSFQNTQIFTLTQQL